MRSSAGKFRAVRPVCFLTHSFPGVLLSPAEAKLFYGTPTGTKDKASCSLWAEYFAFQDDARHKAAREAVMARPAQQTRCRELTMNLAKCMSEYRRFIG